MPTMSEGETAAHRGARSCFATKADGTPCHAPPRSGSQFCFFHDPEVEEERTAARRAGGAERSQPRTVLPRDSADAALGNAIQVADLLGSTINQVRHGELDTRVGNAVGYLASVLLRALDQGQLEDRVAVLERSLSTGDPLHSSVIADHEALDLEFVPAGDEIE